MNKKKNNDFLEVNKVKKISTTDSANRKMKFDSEYNSVAIEPDEQD